MTLEKNIPPHLEMEKEPTITIKRSTEAPDELKKNPFYDPEIWGQAKSADDIYLPDSDEAISFAIAAHEIGHLVKEEVEFNARLDDFEATQAEELRAWKKGWQYLEKHLPEYYHDNHEMIAEIQQAKEEIENLMMQATDLSQEMYLEKGALDNLKPGEYQGVLQRKREEFFAKRGNEIQRIFQQIKALKIGRKPDWDQLIKMVTMAVGEILADNKKND